MIPTRVRHTSGGTWFPWASSGVDDWQLKPAPAPKYINGILCHSLDFGGGQMWSFDRGLYTVGSVENGERK